MVTATSGIAGQTSVSFNFKGSLVFNVFLSRDPTQKAGVPVIPQNSVAGRMVGVFDVQATTPTLQVTGNGTAQWTVAGTYDPLAETMTIVVRSSGVDAKGMETAPGVGTQGAMPVPRPFSTKLNWGWQASRSAWGWEMPWTDDAPTILDAMKAPTATLIPAGNEANLLMAKSLPQTGLNELRGLFIDLKEPEPQTVTQSFQDESGLGIRTTTWALTLIPSFNIERDDRTSDGRHSFVSTDSIRLRMVIPGVTVVKSGWANLVSWEVKGLGPFSGSGIPNQVPHSTTFSFQPNPGTRSNEGSTLPNRPIQYTVRAALEGIEQYFILRQDDVDLLRQEYIDHNESVIPPRGDCLAHTVRQVLQRWKLQRHD